MRTRPTSISGSLAAAAKESGGRRVAAHEGQQHPTLRHGQPSTPPSSAQLWKTWLALRVSWGCWLTAGKSTRLLEPWLSHECSHPGRPAAPRHPARSTSGTGIVLRSERSSAEGELNLPTVLSRTKVVVVDGGCRHGRAFFTAYRQLPHSTSNSASSSRASSILLCSTRVIRLAQRRTAGVRWSVNSRMGSVNCS